MEDLKKWVHTELVRIANLIKDDTLGGAIKYVSKLPLLNLTPLVSLQHLAQLAEETKFTDEFVEYGFTPDSLRIISAE
jgi:hypothetical protein